VIHSGLCSTVRWISLKRCVNAAQLKSATGICSDSDTAPNSYSLAVAVAWNGAGRGNDTGSNASSTGGTPKATALGGVAVSRPRELPVRTLRPHSASAFARSIAQATSNRR
jgi:hypothetical protein